MNAASLVRRNTCPKGRRSLICGDSKSSVLHFNNAGCSLPLLEVKHAVHDFLDLESRYGGYEAAELCGPGSTQSDRAIRPPVIPKTGDNNKPSPESQRLLERPYAALGKLLNCDPRNVAVVSSATAAWQRVFLGLPLWQPGSCVITSMAEYGSNFIAYLQIQKRFGTEIRVIGETPSGGIDLEYLNDLLRSRPSGSFTVVSVTHIPTSSGRVYDAQAVGQLLKRYPDVVYLLDACQSVGQMPMDVQKIRCHFLTATGRKFLRGPRGTGFLYASNEALRDSRLEPSAMDVRGATWFSSAAYQAADSARRFEEYEMSFAAKVGLGVACEYALQQGMPVIWERVQQLSGLLRQSLQNMPGVQVQDVGDTLCGIVSFTVDGRDPEHLQQKLKASSVGGKYPDGVNVSVSRKPSTLLDFDERSLQQVLRASPHYYNSEDEVQDFLTALRTILVS